MRSLYSLTSPAVVLCLLFLMLLGCSSGTNPNPTSPGPSMAAPGFTDPVHSTSSSSTALAGFYSVDIDPVTLDVSYETTRTADLGADVTGFISVDNNTRPDIDFEVTDTSRFRTDGIVGITVTLSNPLDNAGSEIHDVLGVILTGTSKAGIYDTRISYPGGNDILLLNADGYVPCDILNPNKINAYKYFATGIGPETPVKNFLTDPDNQPVSGIFESGSSVSRKYLVRLPENDYQFNFAILAHFGAGMDETFVMDSDLSESSVYYVDPDMSGGDIVADLYLWDWNSPDGNEGLLENISKVIIESPSGMIPGGYRVFTGADLANSIKLCCGGQHMGRFSFLIPDVSPHQGIEQLLITVESNPDPVTGIRKVSYYRTALVPASEVTTDKTRIIVVLDGADVGLYETAENYGDAMYPDIDRISDEIKEIYRTNRENGITTGLESQIKPLVSQMQALRADRATAIRTNLESALYPAMDEMTSKLESIPGVSVLSRDVLMNSLFVETPVDKVDEIRDISGVVEVLDDSFTVEPDINISAQALKLRPGTYPNVVWNQGYHGEGIDVMAMDSGVYWGHPAMSGVTHFDQKFPTYAGGCTTSDDVNHGTCVAGIIASQNSTRRGMAYGIESYYNAKFCNGAWPVVDTLVAAYNWAAIGGSGYNDAEVINFSMGFGSDCADSRALDYISSYVDNTVDLYGVIWCISAGNRGQLCAGNFIKDPPAAAYNTFSVAGVQHNNTGNRGDDFYYNISKYGPVQQPIGSEDRLKPDIVNYTITQAPGYDGGWYWFSGTSAAAPHMTGLSAVLMDAGVPDSLEMRALVAATAEDYAGSPATYGPDNVVGFGIPDAWNAYSHIADTYSSTLSYSSSTDSYQILGVQAGDRVVLYYDKHGVYPSYSISNLDMEAYDKDTLETLHTTTKLYDNKEYIEFDGNDAGRDVIIDVNLTTLGSGLSGEEYAISANTTMTEVAQGDLMVDITAPTSGYSTQYKVIDVTAHITNDIPSNTNSVEASIEVPTGWQLLSGDNPTVIGTMIPYEETDVSWKIIILESGSEATTVNVTGNNVDKGTVADSAAKTINASSVQILSAPSQVTEEDVFNVDASFKNWSDAAYTGLEYDINFNPTYVGLNTGDDPALLGDLPAGDTGNYQWKFEALTPGDTEFSLDVNFSYMTTSVSFSTTPVSVTIEEKPIQDPYNPVLIAPYDNSVYELGDVLVFKWKKGPGAANPTAYYLNAWVNGAHSDLVPAGGVFLGQTTTLILDQRFIEIYAKDGDWEWSIGARVGGNTFWSDKWTITKTAAPVLISPVSGAQVNVNQFFNWDDTPGAINYVAKINGLLPGDAPYYQPLNSPTSAFTLTSEYYNLLKPGVTYRWAVSGTYFLGTEVSADDQALLSRLSYSLPRTFTLE